MFMMLSSQLLGTGRFNDGLPPFITQGLDSEQIWQQLELRNEHSLSFPACTREVVQISSGAHRKKYKESKQNKNLQGDPPAELSPGGDDNEQSDETDNSEEDDDDGILNSIKKRLAEAPTTDKDEEFNDFSDSDSKDELDFDFALDNEMSKGVSDEDEEELSLNKSKKKPKTGSGKKKSSVVDDRFFKLADAEQFLDSEDLKEEKRIQREKKGAEKGNDDSDEEEEDEDDESEEVYMFDELESDNDVSFKSNLQLS